jgi:hypothetical protein
MERSHGREFQAMSGAPVKKLPASPSVSSPGVPVTDRGSKKVDVGFSDFGTSGSNQLWDPRLRRSTGDDRKFGHGNEFHMSPLLYHIKDVMFYTAERPMRSKFVVLVSTFYFYHAKYVSVVLVLKTWVADVNSLLTWPVAHLAFAMGLFYGIQKFFKEVEEKLNAATKLEIAVWLLDLHSSENVRNWPSTFSKVFDRVFSDRYISWKFFWRSCITSAVTSLVAVVGLFIAKGRSLSHAEIDLDPVKTFWLFLGTALISNLLPDYISLLKTGYFLNLSRKEERFTLHLFYLIVDIIGTFCLAICALVIGFFLAGLLYDSLGLPHGGMRWADFDPVGHAYDLTMVFNNLMGSYPVLWFSPAFFGRLWLLLYVGSGLLLKAANHLDVCFAWFNRRFDIENRPLQCIGLVAATLATVGYLAAVGILRVHASR